MAVKNCCVEICNSSTIREEDVGVTFHKFPKDAALNRHWLKATKQTNKDFRAPTFVCSRHFRKIDFEHYMDSKYILKSDAVPSIFCWNENITSRKEGSNMPVSSPSLNDNDDSSCKPPNINVDVEVEIVPINCIGSNVENGTKMEVDEDHFKLANKLMDIDRNYNIESYSTTSYMDIILTEKTKDDNLNTIVNDNSNVPLSVGTKVEARDYKDNWNVAQILEVDMDDMEVLLHYDDFIMRPDEWINVNSPRLRPYTVIVKEEVSPESVSHEMTSEDKQKFYVGERCLARWKNNSRFTATIRKELDNGNYEIIFDDGAPWTCNVSRLFKLKHERTGTKESSVAEKPQTVPNTSFQTNSQGATLSEHSSDAIVPTIPFHTHLFDPTRDYLGSKSERRELKRKLNIKSLFNIGQSKRKYCKKQITENKSTNDGKTKLNTNKVDLEHTNKDFRYSPEPDEDDLEKFEQINKQKHEETICKMKEVIHKLEFGLSTLNNSISDMSSPGNSNKLDKLAIQDIVIIKEDKDLLKEETDTLKEEANVIPIEEKEIEKDEACVVKKEDKDNTVGEIAAKTNILADEQPKKNSSKKSKRAKKLRLIREREVKREVEKVKGELEEMRKQVEEMRKQVDMTARETLNRNNVDASIDNISASNDNIEIANNVTTVNDDVTTVIYNVTTVNDNVNDSNDNVNVSNDAVDASNNDVDASNDNVECSVKESYLLPGEWCCKWVNGEPEGTSYDMEGGKKVVLSKLSKQRYTIKVEDTRLPPLWAKLMVRRNCGSSAGKWDVMLLSPENRKFHTKSEVKAFLDTKEDDSLKEYEHALLDFGIHRKLSRRLGWDDQAKSSLLPEGKIRNSSKLVNKKRIALKRSQLEDVIKNKKKQRLVKTSGLNKKSSQPVEETKGVETQKSEETASTSLPSDSTLGNFVFVGSLKVQILENLLRCPAEGCYKNFRNNTLLRMHIKHYHRDLRKLMGATPKVQDLAYARASPVKLEPRLKKQKNIKGKPRIHKLKHSNLEPVINVEEDVKSAEVIAELKQAPRSTNIPKIQKPCKNGKPNKGPRVLLPVRHQVDDNVVHPNDDLPPMNENDKEVDNYFKEEFERKYNAAPIPADIEQLDFEAAICTHTVPKTTEKSNKNKSKLSLQKANISSAPSEEDDWVSDFDTTSSIPGSSTPDYKNFGDMSMLPVTPSTQTTEGELYITSETGEKIKIVHMKREEIINCHCGFREEDGLMIQCELCLCWQHALCHNIQKEAEVPEKYTCSICLNPRRGRRSQRFLHDQDRLYEGLLPGAKPSESLRRSHELSGNLLRIEDALHALKVKHYVATKKNHPKLYLWAQDWESGELSDKLNSDYSDLNRIIANIGKENLPLKSDDLKDISLSDIKVTPEDLDDQRLSQKSEGTNSFSNLLLSPGTATLDLPINTSELERLAKYVQESEPVTKSPSVRVPQPEAAIENSVCKQRLLKHVQRCQALIDARLDSIEAQVAELESQDPSFEDDESADFFPRTKQCMQMLMRDLDTMEQLGIIT